MLHNRCTGHLSDRYWVFPEKPKSNDVFLGEKKTYVLDILCNITFLFLGDSVPVNTLTIL